MLSSICTYRFLLTSSLLRKLTWIFSLFLFNTMSNTGAGSSSSALGPLVTASDPLRFERQGEVEPRSDKSGRASPPFYLLRLHVR